MLHSLLAPYHHSEPLVAAVERYNVRNKERISNVTDLLFMMGVAIEFAKARDSSLVKRFDAVLARLVKIHEYMLSAEDQHAAQCSMLIEYRRAMFGASGAVSENGAITIRINDSEGAELTLRLGAVLAQASLKNKFKMRVFEFKLKRTGEMRHASHRNSSPFQYAFASVRSWIARPFGISPIPMKSAMAFTPQFTQDYSNMLEIVV